MTDYISKLERLTDLRRIGALTPEEFEEQKALLLQKSGLQSGDQTTKQVVETPGETEKGLSIVWKERFSFFSEYGSTWSRKGAEEITRMAVFERIKYILNFWAFVFGPFYFMFLGLWKSAISLIAMSLIIIIVLDSILPESMQRFSGIVSAVLFASTANYAYFLRRIKRIDSWNPFKT